MSFGFPKGLPRDADLVFDVRFLRNPHYVPALRPLTGRDPAVAAYVEADPDFAGFLARLTGLLDLLLPRFVAEGKKYLTIAIGCTGGRHRSVLVAERLAAHLPERGLACGRDASGTRPRELAADDLRDVIAHPADRQPGPDAREPAEMPAPMSRRLRTEGREALTAHPMIGLVLVTHGRLADELRSAMEHVVGPQRNVATVCIGPDDDMERRRQISATHRRGRHRRRRRAAHRHVRRHALQPRDLDDGRASGVEVIAGVNLPMLVKLAKVRSSEPLADAVDLRRRRPGGNTSPPPRDVPARR